MEILPDSDEGLPYCLSTALKLYYKLYYLALRQFVNLRLRLCNNLIW